MNKVDEGYSKLTSKTKRWLDQVNGRVVNILREGANYED